MSNNTNGKKEIYNEIQKKIFDIVPGKWDELYLYASIIDRLGSIQTGEMYFYFLPKGILKKRFINVYEVPAKYDIDEEEYMQEVEVLYDLIKKLREEYAKSGQKIWSNITISIKDNKFKIEYNYDNLTVSKEEYYDHHIYWRYKYLHLEPQGKREKQAIEKYCVEKKNKKIFSKC